MTLVFISIPIMVLALVITLVPLIVALRIEWAEQRAAARRPRLVPPALPEEERLAA